MTDGWLLREMVAGGGHGPKSLETKESGDEEGRGKGKGKQKEIVTTASLIPQYSILIIDEAHERTIRTDLILGLAKKIQKIRKQRRREWILKGRRNGEEVFELKILVMSATINAESFAEFFSKAGKLIPKSIKNKVREEEEEEEELKELGLDFEPERSNKKKRKLEGSNSVSELAAPILYVKGRQHAVTLYHTEEPVDDFPLAALKTILQIHTSKPEGDILVFMTGQEDIDNLCGSLRSYGRDLEGYGEELEKRKARGAKLQVSGNGEDQEEGEKSTSRLQEMLILPLYASLGLAASAKIFNPSPPNTRKIVIATNIAETSITIPGIKYVIDSGFSKEKTYDTVSSISSLTLTPISKSNALQRSGRAGRDSEGQCYRLYTSRDYKRLDESVKPEILRNNLEETLLDLFSMGINPETFDWLDRPSKDSLDNTLISLAQLEAIKPAEVGGGLIITDLGKKMSNLPLPPISSRTLLESVKFGTKVTRQVRDLVAILSSDRPNLFLEPNFDDEKRREEFEKVKIGFKNRDSDHGTVLNVFYEYLKVVEEINEGSSKISKGENNLDGISSNGKSKKSPKIIKEEIDFWCKNHFLNQRSLKEVMEIRKQLILICQNNGIECDDQVNLKGSEKGKKSSDDSSSEDTSKDSSDSNDEDDEEEEVNKESSTKNLIVSKGGSSVLASKGKNRNDGNAEDYEELRKCLLVGRKNRIGMRQTDGSYKIVHGKEVS